MGGNDPVPVDLTLAGRAVVTEVQKPAPFYEYPVWLSVLLQLGYLEELEQGVFMRHTDRTTWTVHPDLNDLALKAYKRRTENTIFTRLVQDRQLFAQGNEVFNDAVVQERLDTECERDAAWPELRTSRSVPTVAAGGLVDDVTVPANVPAEEDDDVAASEVTESEFGDSPIAPAESAWPSEIWQAQASGTWRDALNVRGIVTSGARYEGYRNPPHLQALLDLGVLVQVNAGVFQLVHRPEHRMPVEVLPYLAVKGHANRQEEDYLQFLLDNEMLFDCTPDWSQFDPTREYVCNMFWDENVEAQERHRQGVPVSSSDYNYDMDVEALLELGVLTEVEKGLFSSASRSSTRRIDPARLGRIARQMHEDGSATAVLRHLAKSDVLFACADPAGGANMWMDRKYYFAHLMPASLLEGGACVSEARAFTVDMPSGETRRSWRDGHQAALNPAPRARYTYPPRLLALLELGYLMEVHKGVFERQNVPNERFVHPLRGQLARECAQRQSEDELLQELLNDGVLFDCKGDSKFDLFWDNVVESFESERRAPAPQNALQVAGVPTEVELCDVSSSGLSALLGSLPASFTADRDLEVHKAPRLDNSNPRRLACTINGKVLQHLVVDTGCEMIVMGREAARQAEIKPSTMKKGAVALRCADERVTAPFDRSLERIPVVLNPGTVGETTVGAYVVVTPGDNDIVLLGMSVIGKVGLTANAYKGKMKYYKDWQTRGTTSVGIPAVFEVLHRGAPLSSKIAKEAVVGTPTFGPLTKTLWASFTESAESGLVVVELCAGIMASTEALIRMGIKIKQLHCCESDQTARAVVMARLKTLSGIFPDLLAESAFENCFGLLPQDVKLINQSHIIALGPLDLVVCGFPCQGFSRASGTAKGLRDPRTAVFVDVVRLVHRIIRHQGNCAWLFENVDASDHPDLQVRQEFNEVVKGVLGQACAFDAVAVGSYAHRYRQQSLVRSDRGGMTKPTAAEREGAMGFVRGTTVKVSAGPPNEGKEDSPAAAKAAQGRPPPDPEPDVEYLGHRVVPGGTASMQVKVEAIVMMRSPT
ncbi:hypothetical protein KFL_014710010 [Klebsormidium nitens]|uniref:Uncharacterized protein n=1 Tax=Klebsormidium nitens TaxID=105231 RepID=A0A1Y1IRN9_KLENI|nr:hypothetical protein KFL_014710010 [Klebsormidium nitens]|eukprot:GAQ93363.1 hypothetical protein KFL_014710010 [Klebsormidium nitens]